MGKNIIKLASKIKFLILDNGNLFLTNSHALNEKSFSECLKTAQTVLPNSLISLCVAEIPIKKQIPTMEEILQFIIKNRLKGIKAFFVQSCGHSQFLNENFARVEFYDFKQEFVRLYEKNIDKLKIEEQDQQFMI